jgi:hypothetical protein
MAQFADQIVMMGIDLQHVLIEGTPDLVRAKTREILDVMKPVGYIALPSHDYLLTERRLRT